MQTRNHADFVAAVVSQWPELRAELEPANAGIDAAVSTFGIFTNSAKNRGDWPTYELCLALVDRIVAGADSALAAAVQAHYFQHLDFEGSRGPAAWQLLSPALQSAWRRMDAENRRLMALPQGRRKSNPGPNRGSPQQSPRGPGAGRGPKGPRGPRGPKGPRGRGGRRGGNRGR